VDSSANKTAQQKYLLVQLNRYYSALLGNKILGQTNIFALDIKNFNPKVELYHNLYTFGLEGEVFAITSRDHSRREFKYKIGQKELRNKKGRVKGGNK